jgi:tripartite-type tricarboxylate transporter receptor subunit TctC
LPDLVDRFGTDGESQDAMERLESASRGREGAARADLGGATLGSTSHFFPALIEKAAGIKFKYVSYEGLAPRMNAILGGHVDLTDANMTQKGKVEAGQLKFIAIATEKRNPEIPNVPTLKELGINVVYDVNRGIMVPKGTPAEAIAKLETPARPP